MEDIISKEWNGYGFRMIAKSKFPAVLEHLRNNFYLDEPLHAILGITPERVADMDQKITDILNLEHGSFCAFRTSQPQNIAAVLIMWNQKKGVELPYFEPQSPLTGLERKTALQLKKQYNIHEERGVDVYPEIFIISTDRDHRGKGLATEMYRRAIASVKSEGHKIVASTFTNPASRRIGQNLHFETVSRIELNDIKYDDGSLVFGRSGNKKFIVQTVLNL